MGIPGGVRTKNGSGDCALLWGWLGNGVWPGYNAWLCLVALLIADAAGDYFHKENSCVITKSFC